MAGCWFGTGDEDAVNVSALGHNLKPQNETRIKREVKENWCGQITFERRQQLFGETYQFNTKRNESRDEENPVPQIIRLFAPTRASVFRQHSPMRSLFHERILPHLYWKKGDNQMRSLLSQN